MPWQLPITAKRKERNFKKVQTDKKRRERTKKEKKLVQKKIKIMEIFRVRNHYMYTNKIHNTAP